MAEVKQPIHVAHVLHSFRIGGLENGVVNLINTLPVSDYRHSIICVTDFDEAFYSRITVNNCDIYCLNKPPGKGLGWLWRCWKLFRKIKPDVIHSRNLSALESQLAKFFTGARLSVHGEHGWDVGDIGGANLKNQRIKRFFRPLIDRFIALSKEGEAYLIDKVNVDASRVTRICNGVDIDKFDPSKPRIDVTDMPATFAHDANTLTFGTVGRLAKVKNQTHLMAAFIQLAQDNPDFRDRMRLIIVGDGILLEPMQAMAKEAGVESLVWFAGSRNDVPVVLRHFDVFVLPSLAEGISNVFLEAMAAGLPVIATKVGGNGDLIYSGHSDTHLVDVDDVQQLTKAMQQYVDDNKKLNEDSAAVLQHCRDNFSIQTMVAKYHNVYQQVTQ